MTFPTLYKKAGKKVQLWEIWTEANDICTRFGQLDGKKQEARKVGIQGKSMGKKNATTPEVQAAKDAMSFWQQQLKKGYVDSIEKAEAGVTDDIIIGGLFPMLAHVFKDHGEKISYPAYVQPKLDGHRSVGFVETHKPTELWSRTRKPVISAPHIIEEMTTKWFTTIKTDGELYNHTYHDNFDALSSAIRQQKTPSENHKDIQYHIYDIVDYELPFSKRLDIMNVMKAQYESEHIHFVETILVNNEDELMLAFEHFLKQGYEGAIVRNAAGKYINKRSYDLQKIKEFDDAEFVIVGVYKGTGKMANKAIFTCVTESGVEFGAKMKGKLEDLVQYLDNPALVIGRKLTVQYQGLTNKNKVPRFPVGLRFYEEI